MAVEAPPAARPDASAVSSMRGSALLLVGRFLAIGSAMVVQVLIVRHLSQSAYGAFAFALAVTNLLTFFVGLGLGQAVQRFAIIYEERGTPQRLAGAVLLQLVTVVVLGTLVVAGTWVVQDPLVPDVISDRRAVSLLTVLALLAPLQAFDAMVMGLFAAFARPGMIFWRRYVLAPALKIAVALAVVVQGASVTTLAWGYVVATLVGMLLCLPTLVRMLVARGVFRRGRRIEWPVRELFGYSTRAIVSDLVVILLFASDVVIVGALGGTEQVALLQSVQPLAAGNLLILYAMIPMFMPQATRLYAQGDRTGLARAYSHSSLWIAVGTFPVLVVTVALAEPVTLILFGDRYAGAAPVLVALALSQFTLAVFGLTGLTCKAVAALGLLAKINVGVAILNISINIALVSRFGALGAACGTLASMVLLSWLKCHALQRATGVTGLDPVLMRGLALIAVTLTAMSLWVWLADPPYWMAGVGAVLSSLLVVVGNRTALDAGAIFPELLRTRPGRWLCAG